MPVERDLVPEQPPAVLIGLRETAGGNFVTELLDTQAQIGSRNFLRIAADRGSVLLEPF